MKHLGHVFEDIQNRYRLRILDAYREKHRFIHLAYEAWLEARKDIEVSDVMSEKLKPCFFIYVLVHLDQDLFELQLLRTPAWNRLNQESHSDTATWELMMVKSRSPVLVFAEDLLYFLKEFDTRDSNFFFSTFLTALLTYNLSWVLSIADQGSKKEEEFTDEVELQFANLHGMVKAQLLTGSSSQNQKSCSIFTDRSSLCGLSVRRVWQQSVYLEALPLSHLLLYSKSVSQ